MHKSGFAAIGLHQPKNTVNVGEVLRAAACFNATMVAVSGTRYKRSRTDTTAAYRHLPLIECDDLKLIIPHDATPVAVEITNNARDLTKYTHPRSAFYIFGPEDGSIPADTLVWCRDVVQIPSHHCLNLAAAVNVVLYDRMLKRAK
jgi:tRNA(Leu) C34 or U34 (ribose-2'-O)-methylase TrmL